MKQSQFQYICVYALLLKYHLPFLVFEYIISQSSELIIHITKTKKKASCQLMIAKILILLCSYIIRLFILLSILNWILDEFSFFCCFVSLLLTIRIDLTLKVRLSEAYSSNNKLFIISKSTFFLLSHECVNWWTKIILRFRQNFCCALH